MARIVMAGQISGTRNGKDWPVPGTEIELPDVEAADLVRSGMAYEPGDERIKHLGNGNGGQPFSDEMLAGAPQGRDWTEGQADTNLARARFLELADGDARDIARAAAERAELDDAHTIPQADPDRPTVGDGKPDPTDAPAVESAAVEPVTEKAATTGKPATRKA